VILLDTHALIWLDTDDRRLGPTSRQMIQRAWANDRVTVSAITFWECALLVAHGRLQLPSAPMDWRAEMLAAGFEELPIDGGIAMQAVELEGLHKDPADRFIAATAIRAGAILLTGDARLLSWQHDLVRHDAQT
jgi:PIN domain nuclease of toxin-antitoxin system